MSWRELLQNDNETITLPWIGSRELRSFSRKWTIAGFLPHEHGWYVFNLLKGRTATVSQGPVEPLVTTLSNVYFGYLVGDRFATGIVDQAVVTQPLEAAKRLSRVHLINDDVDRFARVSVGTVTIDGPLFFRQVEMPLGPEDDVLRAYEDRAETVNDIKGVTPALDAAFRMALWQRTEAERRRAELERLRAEEEARLAAEVKRQELIKQLGDGAGRRAMAQVDFEAAARAALAIGGAELLDWKAVRGRPEYTVRYRLNRRRFECVCDANLHIIDAGVCLQDHRTGIKGDDRFTLESLPGVIQQAEREDKLVVFRNVY
jgi:hypothetical protein